MKFFFFNLMGSWTWSSHIVHMYGTYIHLFVFLVFSKNIFIILEWFKFSIHDLILWLLKCCNSVPSKLCLLNLYLQISKQTNSYYDQLTLSSNQNCQSLRENLWAEIIIKGPPTPPPTIQNSTKMPLPDISSIIKHHENIPYKNIE